MLRVRWISLVIVAAVACFALMAALVSSSVAGPGADPSRGTAACRTDSAGYCTVPHSFGQTPASAVLTPRFYPSTRPFFMGMATSGNTPSLLRVRAMFASGNPVSSLDIEFSYDLAAGPPPTTTPPVTTTTTSVPTTTTTQPPAPGGYPTASTTGVPVGTVLTVHDGDYHATAAGQVIDSLHITGALLIEAPGVVIRKSQVDNEIQNWRTAASSFTVEDSTIGPASGCIYQAGIYGHHFTVTRAHIRNKVNGFTLTDGGNAVVRDSYIRACTPPGDDSHSDGFETCCGPLDEVYDNITLDHNTIDLRGHTSVTAAIDLDKAVNQRNVRLTDNLIGGGAYEMYLYNPLAPSSTSPKWIVSGTKFIDQGWAFGPLTTRDNTCANVDWGPGNEVVAVDSDYRITGTVRGLACNS